MKRTKIITAFLLCACLIVGVGYAAVSDVMDITGTTTYNKDNALDAQVYFKEPGKSNKDNNIQLIEGNDDKVSFNVTSLAATGNYTYFWVKLVNESDVDVDVHLKEYVANSDGKDYYRLAYYMGELDATPTTENYAPVSAKYIEAALETSDGTTSFKYLEKAGEKYTDNPDNNGTVRVGKGKEIYVCLMVVLEGKISGEGAPSIPSSGSISATFSFEIDVAFVEAT